MRALALRLSIGMLVAVALIAGAPGASRSGRAQVATPTATPVTTGNIPLLAISPAICVALVLSRFSDPYLGASHASNCTLIDSSSSVAGGTSTLGHFALLDLEKVIGNGDGILEPSDFASIDLDGNQVHQSDDSGGGTSTYDGNLLILAFVPSAGPVTFSTDRGLMIPAGLNSPLQDLTLNPADPASPVYVCDSHAGSSSGPLVEDADCTGGLGADGVVVGRLRAHWGATTAPIGPGMVTVSQGATGAGTIAFNVVGEPATLSLTTVETTIEDGAGAIADCPLPGSASGLLAASGTAKRSLVLAVARDIDGNAVTGAVIEWSTDDPNKARLAAALTLTLDLGALGFATPNIICGNTTTGTVTVTAMVHPDLGGFIPYFDPGATVTSATAQFNVVSVLDTDGDGCRDDDEPLLVPPTDPTNPWDFYSVPIPALFAAPDPLTDFKDNAVAASDAQAVFAYFKKAAKIGSPEYEQDLNANGIKDGVEYDRSPAASGGSGPPDGIISASDAELAFAQFKLGYHC